MRALRRHKYPHEAVTAFWVFLAAIAFRIVMHFVDKNRIKDEVETQLGRVVSIAWAPIGRGWFFEKNERHYDVSYIDRSGATITTTCKTPMFTGVYGAEGPKLAEPPARHCRAIFARMRLLAQRRVARLSQLR